MVCYFEVGVVVDSICCVLCVGVSLVVFVLMVVLDVDGFVFFCFGVSCGGSSIRCQACCGVGLIFVYCV